MLLTADVDPIPARFVPMLGLNDKVGIADPAITVETEGPAWGLAIITAVRCLSPTDPARAMVACHVTHWQFLSRVMSHALRLGSLSSAPPACTSRDRVS